MIRILITLAFLAQLRKLKSSFQGETGKIEGQIKTYRGGSLASSGYQSEPTSPKENKNQQSKPSKSNQPRGNYQTRLMSSWVIKFKENSKTIKTESAVHDHKLANSERFVYCKIRNLFHGVRRPKIDPLFSRKAPKKGEMIINESVCCIHLLEYETP